MDSRFRGHGCSVETTRNRALLDLTQGLGTPSPLDVIPGPADGVIWSCDLTRHASGDASFAVARANSPVEDQSELECGRFGTYAGVYDGHGGAQASVFLRDNFFNCLMETAGERGSLGPEALRLAVQMTEAKFLEVVRENWHTKPQYAAVGSCMLMAVLKDGMLHVASIGDSRAVLGRRAGIFGGIAAVELSVDHNANNPVERDELRRTHPGEKDIVVEKSGVWRVKGIIQVTRSVGDFYLKRGEFQREPLMPRFRLPHGLQRPALTSEPSVRTHQVSPQDRFLVLASDGLWDHVPFDEACKVAAKHQRMGVARALVRLALSRACRVHKLDVSDLPRVDPSQRRQVHDDITAIVLFFDYAKNTRWPTQEQQGGASTAQPGQEETGWANCCSLSIKGLQEFTPAQLRNRRPGVGAGRLPESPHTR